MTAADAFHHALARLARRESLDAVEMTRAMESIVTGKTGDDQIEKFLLLLREKKETAVEIFAAAAVMRKVAVKTSRPRPALLDTCGTGGDGCHTLNVSTLAALVAAAGGARVAKHGNRSVSSLCGSADILEGLGVRIELPLERLEACLDETGFAFFFAPNFHPATRYAMPARKRIRGKTIFNVLGPLANPAGVDYQLLGVYEERLVPVLAEALADLGIKKALVVYGLDGVDEISLSGETVCAEVSRGKIANFVMTPEAAGLPRTSLASLQVSSKESSCQSARKVLAAEPGPARDLVCLNAGAALYAAEKVLSIKAGVDLARRTIVSGAAKTQLEALVRFTNG
ncbi:MAG: anthranilate phosphoribosyltransferase [Candidatus Omnitrophica bacterium]|nr:anthranilate phosphoribosyltransferase [Candidatus Omnitrophota bacterium]